MGRRGQSPSKFANSPAGGKGVQFESDTIEDDDRRKPKSESTDALVTDSMSEEDDINIMQEVNENGKKIPGYIRVPKPEIQEQHGYPRGQLNRIKMRREHELEEFNYGIDFSQLKTSKEQQSRLRHYLMQ